MTPDSSTNWGTPEEEHPIETLEDHINGVAQLIAPDDKFFLKDLMSLVANSPDSADPLIESVIALAGTLNYSDQADLIRGMDAVAHSHPEEFLTYFTFQLSDYIYRYFTQQGAGDYSTFEQIGQALQYIDPIPQREYGIVADIRAQQKRLEKPRLNNLIYQISPSIQFRERLSRLKTLYSDFQFLIESPDHFILWNNTINEALGRTVTMPQTYDFNSILDPNSVIDYTWRYGIEPIERERLDEYTRIIPDRDPIIASSEQIEGIQYPMEYSPKSIRSVRRKAEEILAKEHNLKPGEKIAVRIQEFIDTVETMKDLRRARILIPLEDLKHKLQGVNFQLKSHATGAFKTRENHIPPTQDDFIEFNPDATNSLKKTLYTVYDSMARRNPNGSFFAAIFPDQESNNLPFEVQIIPLEEYLRAWHSSFNYHLHDR